MIFKRGLRDSRQKKVIGIDGVRLKEKPKYEYVPTREEMDKYLTRLKELMEEDDKCQ